MGNLTAAEALRLCHTSELSISARKSYWGTGIAQALMEQLLQFARNSKQIQVIGLTVNAENVRAIRLYQRYGFQEVGCYPRFFHLEAVSYTHLDVYKRQFPNHSARSLRTCYCPNPRGIATSGLASSAFARHY